MTPKIQSLWRYPVGKHGDFFGESTYERVHGWPSKVERQKECKPPPLISTMGMGIIPILGRGDGPQVAGRPSGKKDGEVVRKESVENYLASQRRKNPSYWVRNCDPSRPTEKVWQGETSHRSDYIVHSIGRNAIAQALPHKTTLCFSGKMETMSSAMRDYPDPQVQNSTDSATCECIPDNDRSASDQNGGNINITVAICPNS